MKHTRHRRQKGRPPRAAGFTLVEVLVALIIIAVGMLGLAKIQALAYASTGIAGSQSLAALQASSLASAMRANRSYWSTVANNFSFTNTAGTLASTDATLTNTTYTCTSACTPAQVAAHDLTAWTASLTAVLPKPTATISCLTAAGCSITIAWVENNVSVNAQTQGSTALQQQSYTVFVVP
jgi:type IV pilus assembly protein PilV